MDVCFNSCVCVCVCVCVCHTLRRVCWYRSIRVYIFSSYWRAQQSWYHVLTCTWLGAHQTKTKGQTCTIFGAIILFLLLRAHTISLRITRIILKILPSTNSYGKFFAVVRNIVAQCSCCFWAGGRRITCVCHDDDRYPTLLRARL